ncbi:hypothetical protein ABB07_05350 [Streptomyces incarnatus]|uniref:Uncharacterized protein n=1 Tax=Streptomyces incarnatus TaxID=665007 RepID=A0ABM5TEP0_9ACTN|nr:hypothetical protein ABB07_05350 [Streptomyces incarnatus]
MYGTVRGLPAGRHYGPSTLSADRRTLHLTRLDVPRAESGVRGQATAVRRVTVLGAGAGTGTEPGHRGPVLIPGSPVGVPGPGTPTRSTVRISR